MSVGQYFVPELQFPSVIQWILFIQCCNTKNNVIPELPEARQYSKCYTRKMTYTVIHVDSVDT